MSLLDFGDPKRPVDLVFIHANGFNALTYRTLLAPLSGPRTYAAMAVPRFRPIRVAGATGTIIATISSPFWIRSTGRP